MKYQVFGINIDGEYITYKDDIFNTKKEAQNFINIEKENIQIDNVELKIMKVIDEVRKE